MLILSWADFDQAVAALAEWARGLDIRSIYGPPRGGLVVAVALSHALGPPLTRRPGKHTLWVDDVVERGRTLLDTRGAAPIAACWIAKPARLDVFHVTEVDPETWIVFPWEDPAKAEADFADYQQRRSSQ